MKRSRTDRVLIELTLGMLLIGLSVVGFIEARNFEWRIFVYIAGFACIVIGAVLIYSGLMEQSSRPKNSGGRTAVTMPVERQQLERVLTKGPRIVAIGGGTGLPNLLRGLKEYSSNITAIVTVADDGGGTGRLRHDMGILAPGDIRNCILALADTEPVMERLFSYRFHDGELSGQSFGNIYIAAMCDVSGGFLEAVRHTSRVLAVRGEVLPVTLSDVHLCARLSNGHEVLGESNIPKEAKSEGASIQRVWLDKPCRILPEAEDAIMNADIIVFSQGSLYTSLIPNVLADGFTAAVAASSAVKIAVCNIMTQPGETDGYKLSDHVKALQKHAGSAIINSVIVNDDQSLPEDVAKAYSDEGSIPVENDFRETSKLGVRVYKYGLMEVRGTLVRHQAEATGRAVMDVYQRRRFSDSILKRS